MRKLALLPALAGFYLVGGCQTHDRALYNPEPAPIRSSSSKLAEPRSLSGATVQPTDGLGLPPDPGLDGPLLLP